MAGQPSTVRIPRAQRDNPAEDQYQSAAADKDVKPADEHKPKLTERISAAVLRIIGAGGKRAGGGLYTGSSWMDKTSLLRKHKEHRKRRNRIAAESRRRNRRA